MIHAGLLTSASCVGNPVLAGVRRGIACVGSSLYPARLPAGEMLNFLECDCARFPLAARYFVEQDLDDQPTVEPKGHGFVLNK